jgi:hypothetical protein
MSRLARLADAIAVATTGAFLTAVRATMGDDTPFLVEVAGSFAILAIGFVVLRDFLAVRIVSWPWLRRMVLGQDYVEGTWVDVVTYDDGRSLVGVVRFSPDGTSLRYWGSNYYLDGTFAGVFVATTSKVDMPRFDFAYTGEQDAGKHRSGIGQITFHGPSGPISSFSGFCVDSDESSRHRIRGIRVTDDHTLDALASPATAYSTARALAEPLLPTEVRATS